MNEVLVSLWYIMGLWPLAYSMLLLPTGRRYFPLIYINLISRLMWFLLLDITTQFKMAHVLLYRELISVFIRFVLFNNAWK